MILDDAFVDTIATLLKDVAREELLSRFRTDAAAAHMKSPGELVTEADVAAEAALGKGLRALTPEAAIVGEESAAADAALLDGLGCHELTWLVDPLDGTKHFAAGAEDFGIMLALLVEERCEASWIYLPVDDTLAHARRGQGAWIDGVPLERADAPTDGSLRGGLMMRFFPEALRAHAEQAPGLVRTDDRHHCAARRYVDIACGREDFGAYWRTLPWDHAPGALLLEEAGGVVRRFDSSDYKPCDLGATSLLTARDEATWTALADALLTPR